MLPNTSDVDSMIQSKKQGTVTIQTLNAGERVDTGVSQRGTSVGVDREVMRRGHIHSGAQTQPEIPSNSYPGKPNSLILGFRLIVC